MKKIIIMLLFSISNILSAQSLCGELPTIPHRPHYNVKADSLLKMRPVETKRFVVLESPTITHTSWEPPKFEWIDIIDPPRRRNITFWTILAGGIIGTFWIITSGSGAPTLVPPVSVIPEPYTMILLATGLIFIFAAIKYRQHQKH